MARRRRKQRTHSSQNNAGNKDQSDAPRSFIIKHGNVGSSLANLVRDMRKVMEPNTATRLKVRHSNFVCKDITIQLILSKERTRNKLKDYLVMGPSLHVSHILAFTLTPVSPTLRLIRLPAGPTLTFRIERYSLVKDLLNIAKRARGVGLEYLTPPLVSLRSTFRRF
jgi:ribosome biogenesis protein SSF1/2